MHPIRMLQLCALPMALSLLLAPARAQTLEPSKDEAPLELPSAAPLELPADADPPIRLAGSAVRIT